MGKSPSEIIEIASRSVHHVQAKSALHKLQHDLQQAGEAAEPFLDFVPIRLTTIIEHVVRSSVRRVVDHGEPYSSRGMKMLSKLSGKVIVEALLAFSERKITIGQLVSYSFSTGRLSEILGTLGAIFETDICQEFSTISTKWTEPEKNQVGPIISDVEGNFAAVDTFLKIRHILVHELPKDCPYSKNDMAFFIEQAELFVEALDWLVVSRLYDSVPYTQLEMNAQASDEAKIASDELDALRGGSTKRFAKPQTPEEEIEYYWDKFCDLSARKYAGYLDDGWPGTIAPLLYSSAFRAMTEWRIESIQRWRSPWTLE